ncbi:MAG: gliding motility-associated C-terminal domain-containing protein, partial [Saprospiraceae bacterium]
FGGPSVTGVQELLIFDKWGGLIHQSGTAQSEFRAAWDGRQTGTGKPAPTGVYLYTAGIELVTGEVVRRSGSVTLVR